MSKSKKAKNLSVLLGEEDDLNEGVQRVEEDNKPEYPQRVEEGEELDTVDYAAIGRKVKDKAESFIFDLFLH